MKISVTKTSSSNRIAPPLGPRKIFRVIFLFSGETLLPYLCISLYSSYLFRDSLFYLCKYEYSPPHCVRRVTNTGSTEKEVPPEKKCWGVTITIWSNFRNLISQFWSNCFLLGSLSWKPKEKSRNNECSFEEVVTHHNNAHKWQSLAHLGYFIIYKTFSLTLSRLYSDAFQG